ncbi:MAG TPA: hypothetical protein VEQ60_24665 [Longimicrobium sp.]|nr:hypothetical protein [Longimicrobium sp.]
MTGSTNSVTESVVGARCINGVTCAANQVVVGMTAGQVRQAWSDHEGARVPSILPCLRKRPPLS